MAIRVACTSCGNGYTLADDLAGKKVRCKSCGYVFSVPQPAPPAQRQPPPAPPRRDAVLSEPPPVPLTRDDEEFADVRERVRSNIGRRGPSPLLIGSIVGGAAVLLIGGVLAVVLLGGGGEPAQKAQFPQQQAKADDAKQPDDKQPDDKKPDAKKPDPKEEFNLTEARKSVVYIKRLAPGLPAASGTGFFVSKDGLVYTNRHVIETIPQRDDTRILVGVPKAKDPAQFDYFKAEVVFSTGPGDALDFAILKIAARPEYGAFLPLPLSFDKLDLGAAVAAVGFPGGLKEEAPTVAFNPGVISAPPEKLDNRTHYRTDAQVNPGNSGGPLLNRRGEVVGIITFRKNNAKGMNYALHLSETVQAAKVDPGKVAAVKAEPGPLDEKQVAQLVPRGIEPKAAAWEVTRGRTREQRGFMIVDDDGAPYWITTREDLPDNFQITVKVGVELFVGRQRLQPSQRSILRTMCVRFATADTGRSILEQNNGYQIQFSHDYLLLFKDGKVIARGRDGNPDEPFVLTVARKDDEILMTVNGEVVLKHRDPNPISGRARLSIGGYLSKLYVGELFVTPLPGGKGLPVAKIDPKKDKDPVVVKPKDKDKGKPLPGNPTEIQLAGPVAETAVGGGGRYVLLHMPKAGKLALFDAAAKKVVKEVPLVSADVRLAAGQDKFVVWDGRARVLTRWDFNRFEREASALLPFGEDAKVTSLAMGSASHGPLMLVGTGKLPLGGCGALLDLDTLKPLAVEGRPDLSGAQRVRASNNGKLFAFWTFDGGPGRGGRGAARWDGKTLTTYRDGLHGGDIAYLSPAADGRMLYTHISRAQDGNTHHGGAVLSPEFKVMEPGQAGGTRMLFAAAAGPYYVALRFNEGNKRKLEFFVQGEPMPFAALDDVAFEWEHATDGLSLERRLFVLPMGACVAGIPRERERLLVYPFDLHEALNKSGQDYLVVTSSPPARAERGHNYVYQVETMARARNLTYKLDSGPKGMTLSPKGRLSWAVPPDFEATEAEVLLSITNEKDRQIFHNFKIAIAADTPPQPTKKDPTVGKGKDKGEPVTVALGEPAGDVVAGGGGRWL